jgi:hypothetical protein
MQLIPFKQQQPKCDAWRAFVESSLAEKRHLVAGIRHDVLVCWPRAVFAFMYDKKGNRIAYGIFWIEVKLTASGTVKEGRAPVQCIGNLHNIRESWLSPGHDADAENQQAIMEFDAWAQLYHKILGRAIAQLDAYNPFFTNHTSTS